MNKMREEITNFESLEEVLEWAKEQNGEITLIVKTDRYGEGIYTEETKKIIKLTSKRI